MGGRPQRERIYAYIQLIHFIVQQKLTHNLKRLCSNFLKSLEESTKLKKKKILALHFPAVESRGFNFLWQFGSYMKEEVYRGRNPEVQNLESDT